MFYLISFVLLLNLSYVNHKVFLCDGTLVHYNLKEPHWVGSHGYLYLPAKHVRDIIAGGICDVDAGGKRIRLFVQN